MADWVDYSKEVVCGCSWQGTLLQCTHHPPEEDRGENPKAVEIGRYHCPNCKTLLFIEYLDLPGAKPRLAQASSKVN